MSATVSNSLHYEDDDDPSRRVGHYLKWLDGKVVTPGSTDEYSPKTRENFQNYIRQLLKIERDEEISSLFCSKNENNNNVVQVNVQNEVFELKAAHRHRLATIIGSLTKTLNLSAMFLYVENFEEAERQLEKAARNWKLLKVSPPDALPLSCGHINAIHYLIESLKWLIKKCIKEKKIVVGENVYFDQVGHEHYFVKVSRMASNEFLEQWTKLEGSNDGYAVIQFIRGFLVADLNLGLEWTVKLYESAAQLNTDFHVWHIYHFLMLRVIRLGQTQEDPDQLRIERKACEKAYSLDPRSYECLMSQAAKITDGLWPLDTADLWDHCEALCQESISLLKDALEIAIRLNMGPFIAHSKLLLAKLYLFGKGKLLLGKQPEGKELLEKCALENPNSQDILCTLARLYRSGASETKAYQDFKNAEKYYKRAVEVNPKNFMCLNEYIEYLAGRALKSFFLHRRNTFYKAMLDAIEESFKVVRHRHDLEIVWLETIRASIIGIFNPREEEYSLRIAANIWVKNLKKFPALSEMIFEIIQSYRGSTTNPPIGPELLGELRRLKKKAETTNDQTSAAISDLITVLS